jgi:hypothetical protein
MNAIKYEPPKTHDEPHMIFVGDAILRLGAKRQIYTKFVIRSVGGMLPRLVELLVDPAISEFAIPRGRPVELEICGAKIQTYISSRSTKKHALLLIAAPVFRDLSEAMAGYVGNEAR